MGEETLIFDVTYAQNSGRVVRSESDKLKRLADKLKRNIESVPSWWTGGSRNSFIHSANELVTLMYKSVDIVYDMSEDLLASSKYKKEEEENLKKELKNAVTVSDTSNNCSS